MDRRLLTLCVLLFVVPGAAQSKRKDAELIQLLELYQGRYTNVAQVEADTTAGREPHAAVEINIVRAYAPRISDYTFYIQESAADDPRRIFMQRIVSFQFVKGRGIVQSLSSFVEPTRWRDAHLNQDLFKAMTAQDLSPMSGCEVVWKKKEDGSFEGANDQSTCRVSSEAAGAMVRLKLRAELSVDELALSEQSFDAAGRLLQPDPGDPFYRFRRR
jgi:hypothetical protein